MPTLAQPLTDAVTVSHSHGLHAQAAPTRPLPSSSHVHLHFCVRACVYVHIRPRAPSPLLSACSIFVSLHPRTLVQPRPLPSPPGLPSREHASAHSLTHGPWHPPFTPNLCEHACAIVRYFSTCPEPVAGQRHDIHNNPSGQGQTTPSPSIISQGASYVPGHS